MPVRLLYFTLPYKTKNMRTDKKKEKVSTDVIDLILKHLEEDERDLAWLHRKTGIPYATLYSCFKQRLFKVSVSNLSKINKVLGTNFQ